jgi:hypothetical protein
VKATPQGLCNRLWKERRLRPPLKPSQSQLPREASSLDLLGSGVAVDSGLSPMKSVRLVSVIGEVLAVKWPRPSVATRCCSQPFRSRFDSSPWLHAPTKKTTCYGFPTVMKKTWACADVRQDASSPARNRRAGSSAPGGCKRWAVGAGARLAR